MSYCMTWLASRKCDNDMASYLARGDWDSLNNGVVSDALSVPPYDSLSNP